ncbi:hypothetical protein BJ170DRAFT_180910 [Xylariales sp. AK1849]|nr:hypothetical protein BJ170DRAFT_180910 [Xylariales sp. AK1849]
MASNVLQRLEIREEHTPAAQLPYFPRNGIHSLAKTLRTELPSRPSVVAPILDPAYVKEPLVAFDEAAHGQNYCGASQTGEAVEPPLPALLEHRYLAPSLSHNERLRLTLLWYHTRLIEQDEHLLAKIDALVKGVQQAIGWEYAIAGILDESTFTRLATANLPLVIVPRRESTCSHTITQAPSSVFMVTDLSKDWRFKNSPHVEIGGLRSYAGTQLRLMADDGQEISFGSLCVASDTPQPPLSQDQRDFLVRFAELISSLIASHTRQRRFKERQQMAELLAMLQNNTEVAAYEAAALDVIAQAYPRSKVSLRALIDGQIPIEGRPGILVSEVHEGLWEDTGFIEHAIKSSNFRQIQANQTVRAVVARCGSSNKYIVVETQEVHYVFDDFDAWFITSSASTIADTLQSRLLQQALDAREIFLRGITHQLRTPIHGILGSAEILAEELAAMQLLTPGDAHNDMRYVSTSPAACISTIRRSGRELMTTVNNILKHNTWADGLRNHRQTPYDLYNLEDDILPEVLTRLPVEHLGGMSIRFRQELAGGRRIFTTDVQMLKECLQAIILNATQSMSGLTSGVISVTACSTPDFTRLMFDVVDNGCGIDAANQGRIFEPYEKVDSHKPGAGLGLTLAAKIATKLNGSISLVSSSLGSGSHFRIEFRDPVLDAPVNAPPKPDLPLEHLTRTFCDVRSGESFTHFIDHVSDHLEANGFQRSVVENAGIVVTNCSPEEIALKLETINPKPITIGCGLRDTPERAVNLLSLITIAGSLHTRKLEQTLQQADQLCLTLSEDTAKKQPESVHTIQPDTSEYNAPEIKGVIEGVTKMSVVDDSPTIRCSTLPIEALLVDDNPINLRILEMFCHKRKIPYVTARDGDQAFNHFTKTAETGKPFTLVLMDLQMPHCDGVQATAAIRSYEKQHGLKSALIFMVTGQDSEKDKAESTRAGADEYLVKPVGPRELDRHIGRYFTSYQYDA